MRAHKYEGKSRFSARFLDELFRVISTPLRWRADQVAMYMAGCVIFSLGAKFFIDARLGTDPLDVLVIGINGHLHAGMGICSSIVAAVFLSWWTIWNRKIPPLTPFVTTAAVGFLLDLWTYLRLDQYTGQFLSPWPMLAAGLAMCSYGSALIIMSGIGIRIMDLVALTMIKKWNWSFFRAKMTVEVGMFVTGWMLGGPLGIATVAFLFFVGPFIQPFMLFNEKILLVRNYGLAPQTAK